MFPAGKKLIRCFLVGVSGTFDASGYLAVISCQGESVPQVVCPSCLSGRRADEPFGGRYSRWVERIAPPVESQTRTWKRQWRAQG